MLTVLVANTKGGCGKTTIATHLASAFAVGGFRSALADADRQRSSLAWLERRPASAAPIEGVDWVKDIAGVPKRIDRLVIDAPAAMRIRSQVEPLLARADVIVLPVLPSAFDERATARFLGRIETLKPIRKEKAALAVVANRVRPRTRAAQRLAAFLDGTGHDTAAWLHERALYADLAVDGLALFDLTTRRGQAAAEDWSPLITFIERHAS